MLCMGADCPTGHHAVPLQKHFGASKGAEGFHSELIPGAFTLSEGRGGNACAAEGS